jgi:hypothetical protein
MSGYSVNSTVYYHYWARFLVILPISVISFLNTKIYLAVRLVSYSTIYSTTWPSSWVLGILPISFISFLNNRILLAARSVSYSCKTIYYHNRAHFLVFCILPIYVISFLHQYVPGCQVSMSFYSCSQLLYHILPQPGPTS